MNVYRIFFFISFGISLTAAAQTSWMEAIPPKVEVHYQNYAALLFDGMPLWDGESTNNPLQILQMRGKLTVNAVERKTNKPIEGKALGFMIGIKDHDTNTIWMLSAKTYYEIEVEELKGKIDFGDVLLIMTVDRTYRLPRHELTLDGDC